jgi:cysteine desulfurase/selenocysteine lyase
VAKAVGEAVLRAGNPGRSGHALSIRSARDLFVARERLAELFGSADSSRFVFTENATVALNQAIKGVLRPGDHVVTTSVEHNSVMRPLRRMQEAGVRVTVVPAGKDGGTEARDVIAAFRKATRLVVMVHASNVSGALQPVDVVVLAARRRGILTLIDAAQTAGAVPIDLSTLPVDLLAASGHKGLLGPQGTGFLFVREGVPIVPLIEGGREAAPSPTTSRNSSLTPSSPGPGTAWGRPGSRSPLTGSCGKGSGRFAARRSLSSTWCFKGCRGFRG